MRNVKKLSRSKVSRVLWGFMEAQGANKTPVLDLAAALKVHAEFDEIYGKTYVRELPERKQEGDTSANRFWPSKKTLRTHPNTILFKEPRTFFVCDGIAYLVTPTTDVYFYKGTSVGYFMPLFNQLVQEPLQHFTATNKDDGHDVKICLHPGTHNLPRGVSYEKVLESLSTNKKLSTIEPETGGCTVM